MAMASKTRIFARHERSGFIGRQVHVSRLMRQSGESGGGLVLLATPGAGASELLRHTYDRLFHEQQQVIPFYFEIKPADRTSHDIARRFLYEFLLQAVAFRRRDPRIIAVSPTIAEMAELAAPADVHWIEPLIAIYHGEGIIKGEHSFVRHCLSATLRAAANGIQTYTMVDGLHSASNIEDGEPLVADLEEIFSRLSIPFVFAGHRRFLYPRMDFAWMDLEPLSFDEAGQLIEKLCREKGVNINDQTRDLIAIQLGGNAAYISSFISSVASARADLRNFDRIQQAYTDEIFGGRFFKQLDLLFGDITDAETQGKVLRLLSENAAAPNRRLPVQYWRKQLKVLPDEFHRLLGNLHYQEIINIESGQVSFDDSNLVVSDYINARARLELEHDPRALAVGRALSANIKRAPAIMARHYRKSSAIGLRELMRQFDGQEVSSALIDYARFRESFKGLSGKKITDAIGKDTEKFTLPNIVYSAHSADLYSRLNEICDPERSAVGFGSKGPAEEDDIVWIAAEIESKLEASAELAEFWCDRLEMVAVSCNLSRYQLWLIAPEGFTPDALAVLRERNAEGSSRKQIQLLLADLEAELPLSKEPKPDEYEIVVPMGEDTEIIAANAVEQIAKRAHFTPNAITQIKTALVEACINAAEHSLSPDKKIYQKFAVDEEKLVVTVTNRGLRLTDKNADQVRSNDGRRGWGLKLMKGLMDDVRIEQTDDGTRITMVKYIRRGAYQFPEPV